METLKNLAFGLLAVLLCAACHPTIHEHPDDDHLEVTLQLTVDNHEPELYMVVDYTEDTPTLTTVAQTARSGNLITRTLDPASWQVHIVWELHSGTLADVKAGQSVLISKGTVATELQEQPTHSVVADITAGRYTLLAWADYTPTGTDEDWFYDTADMANIRCDLERRTACTDNDQRDCFQTAFEFSVSGGCMADGKQFFSATLTRPQGRYVVLATDYDKYLQLTSRPVADNRAYLTYPSYINTGFTVPGQRPNESTRGVEYTLTPALTEFEGQTVVRTADDYSFVNGDVSYVTLDMKITNPDLGQLSSCSGINIPLYADRLTVVIGKFLTDNSNHGGLSIDDNFDDEITIHF